MMTFPTEWKNNPNVPNHQPAESCYAPKLDLNSMITADNGCKMNRMTDTKKKWPTIKWPLYRYKMI